MTATNHVLAGALIGCVLPLPVAIPVAFVSHFIMDAVPHYGAEADGYGKSKMYRLILATDTAVALLTTIPLIINSRWDMLICGFIAYSPDIPIVYHYLRTRSTDGNHHWPFRWRLFTLPHHEYEWGIIVELILFAVMLSLFISQLS